MAGGGITQSLNHATKQRREASCVNATCPGAWPPGTRAWQKQEVRFAAKAVSRWWTGRDGSRRLRRQLPGNRPQEGGAGWSCTPCPCANQSPDDIPLQAPSDLDRAVRSHARSLQPAPGQCLPCRQRPVSRLQRRKPKGPGRRMRDPDCGGTVAAPFGLHLQLRVIRNRTQHPRRVKRNRRPCRK